MPRLQFSLRALLLLMAIVGAAIVVYRWPWTETEVEYSGTRVTTFRRGWNGKAVRHGERRHTDSHQIVDEEWYEQGLKRAKFCPPANLREHSSPPPVLIFGPQVGIRYGIP